MAQQTTPKPTVAPGHRVTIRPGRDTHIGYFRAQCNCGQSAIYLKDDVATVAAEQHVSQGAPLEDA